MRPGSDLRTKIVATIGPATAAVDKIHALAELGVDVVRLNFAHGTHEGHGQVIKWVREAAIAGGMISMGEDGLQKVKSGQTTAEELLRVVTEVRQSRRGCETCGIEMSAAFAACPHCGRQTGNACPHCRRGLQPDWRFCPHCTKPVTAESALETGPAGGRRTLALARSSDR